MPVVDEGDPPLPDMAAPGALDVMADYLQEAGWPRTEISLHSLWWLLPEFALHELSLTYAARVLDVLPEPDADAAELIASCLAAKRARLRDRETDLTVPWRAADRYARLGDPPESAARVAIAAAACVAHGPEAVERVAELTAREPGPTMRCVDTVANLLRVTVRYMLQFDPPS